MLYSVQFLRGIAALLVVMTHIVNKEVQYGICTGYWFNMGKAGIDLFFIISGFIMCYTTDNKKVSFARFIKHRIERIIPLYWLLTTLALILYFMPFKAFYAPDDIRILDSYFLLPLGKKYLVGTGWTLSYEFYFYFIFALFLLAPMKSYSRYIGVILTIIFLTCLGWTFGKHTALVDFIFSYWLMEFVWGIVAFIFYKHTNFSFTLCILMILAGLPILFYQNINDYLLYDQYRFFYIGLPMLLIFNGFLHLEKYLKTFQNYLVLFFQKLGNSSYSLYLTHPFALVVMSYICMRLPLTFPLIFFLCLLVSSILLGLLSYRYIEQPMINWLRKRF